MNKKDYPLTILEALQNFVELKGDTFEVINPGESLLKIVDNDDKSPFYFNIEKFDKQQGGSYKLLLNRMPTSKSTHKNFEAWIETKDLQTQFSAWLELINGYNKVKSFFDDPILNSFTEEYFSEFEIIDEDAHIKPLSTKQILLLDQHLEFIQENIEKHQTDSNKLQIQEIKSDVIELRENLTRKSKAWVIKRLSKTWGKITKQGPKFLKEFLNEARKQIIVEGIKYIVEHGPNLLK